MKKLYSSIALVALIGINASAQTSSTVRTSQIKTNLGLVKQSMLGSSERIEDCDTLSNFCPDDTLVLYTVSNDGGYVAGQNVYGDVSKADVFTLPGTSIKGVLLYFGLGTAVDTLNQFKVRIWDNDGSFADGAPGAPGTVLAETLVKYNDVKNDVANGEMTYVEFTPDVTMSPDSTFYAGINFGYNDGDTIALVTSLDRTGLSCDGKITAVEEWSPDYYGGGWYTYATWGFNGVSNAIYPVTCVDGCNTPEGLVTKDITATSVKFKWAAAVGATAYKLRYKIATTGTWTLLSPQGLHKNVEGLTPGTKYVWQMRSVCGTDPKITSDWSVKQFFTTAPLRLATDIETALVEVFPNPISNSAAISFSLPKAIHTTIELYDVAGRKLKTILDQNLAAGSQQVILQREQLMAGIYLIQVKMGDQLAVKKLVVE